MLASISAERQYLYSVAATKNNKVILQGQNICARDPQHALIQAAQLISEETEFDAGDSGIKYYIIAVAGSGGNV